MKKILFLLFLLFLFFNCSKNNIKILNILTDDILLYELVDNFNLNSNYIKVKLDYINNSEENIFKFVQDNQIKSYDIIAGYYFPDTIIDSNNYSEIDISFENKDIFNYIKESYKKNKFYFSYSIDFPVIVLRKEKIKNSTANEISIEDFIKLSQNNNSKKDKFYETRISFSPLLSEFFYPQYYFIFNILDKKSNLFYFDEDNLKKSFVFSTNFDNKYNYGIDFTKKYLDKYRNIEKRFFLNKGIIFFDFKNFSETFDIDKNNFSISLIKEMKYPSLKEKVIAIRKNSLLKKEALFFVKYLIEKDSQKRLNNVSLNFTKKHIPIYKDLLKQDIIDNEIIIHHIDDFKSIEFYNKKSQYNFFQIIKKIHESEEFLNMSEEKFISYFFDKINK